MPKTIFKRIIDGEIPADVVYEDDDCLVFRDVSPQAPTHVLAIPKREIASLDAAADEDALLLGRLLLAVRDAARRLGVDKSGYRVTINCGPEGGQTVDHLHLHLLGGRPMTWPPG
jgi:histidine triad (HIT) family protein